MITAIVAQGVSTAGVACSAFSSIVLVALCIKLVFRLIIVRCVITEEEGVETGEVVVVEGVQ